MVALHRVGFRPLQVFFCLSILAFSATHCAEDKAAFNSKKIVQERTPEEDANRRTDHADAKAIHTLEFTAGTIEEGSVLLEVDRGIVEQTLVMAQAQTPFSLVHQIERERTSHEFRQGFDGNQITESFDPLEPGKVDILIVVDDSQTMEPIQAKLADGLPHLLTHIANLNWQIAVNTTSSECLRETAAGVKVLTKSNYDADAAKVLSDYKELIRVGNKGNNFEQGIRSATKGLLGECSKGANNWRRQDAKPALLIVSDERNCGSASNEGCTGDTYETGAALLSAVPNVRTYALLLLEQYAAACPDLGGYDNFYPTNYVDLVDDTGGLYEGICQDNYNAVMTRISQDVSEQVVKTYELAYEPENQPLVRIDDAVSKDGYTIAGRILTLTKDLPLSTESLTVTYKHQAVARQISWDLSGTPDPRTPEVFINGNLVKREAYTVSALPPKLTFNEMPGDLAKITINYRQNTNLQRHFAFSSDAVPGTVAVSISGVMIEQEHYTVDDTTHQVTIMPEPLDGQEIKILFERPDDRIVRYPVPGNAALVEGVSAFDALTKEPIPVHLDGAELVFPWEAVHGDREVLLHLNINQVYDQPTFELPSFAEPLAGTLQIKTNGATSDCSLDGIKGGLFQVSCQSRDFDQLAVTFKYAQGYTNVFDLGAYSGGIRVFVGDKETTDYDLTDGFLTIGGSLPLGTAIKVILLNDVP